MPSPLANFPPASLVVCPPPATNFTFSSIPGTQDPSLVLLFLPALLCILDSALETFIFLLPNLFVAPLSSKA